MDESLINTDHNKSHHGYGIYYKEFDSGGEINGYGISVSGLDLSIDNKIIFDNLDFSLSMRDRVTIVGENGSGKTTFLKLLFGADYPYSGSIIIEGRVGLLPQHFEHVDGDELAILTLLKSLHDPYINEFLKQSYEPFSPEWNNELNSLGGHEIFKQANLSGLSNDIFTKPFKNLSGGEKTKIMLCGLSILEPDIICLDEPTNHLDSQGMKWLENFLRNFDGGVIMVTHDRTLINAVSNRISELSPHTKRFAHFRGGYKNYLEEEEKRRIRAIQERQRQEKEIKVLKQKTNKFEGKIKGRIIRPRTERHKLGYDLKEQRAQKGRNTAYLQVKEKLQQINENLVEVIPERNQITFDFDDNPALNIFDLKLEVSNLSKSYNEPLFSNVSFNLIKGERLIIQGPNGAGKSTILKIIMDQIKPDEGSVSYSRSAVIGYLDQEQESLPLDKSAIDLLKEDPLINATQKEAIKYLCNFGIYTWHDLNTPLKELSVGCRRKAQLCQIIMKKCSILLLDEPTNHIDLPSLEIIEDALLNFPGIIIAATHDRYFSEKVGTKILDITEYKPT